MDRNELKVVALRERVSELTTAYEDRAADYRVEITLLTNENEELRRRIVELEAPDETESYDENPE